MKAMRFATLMAAGILVSYITTGCHPENMRKIPGTPMPPPDMSTMPAISAPPPTFTNDTNATPTMIAEPDVRNHTNWVENADQFKADTIHFAYDSSVVRSADKSKISDVADYLKNHPNTAVRVEGNCD